MSSRILLYLKVWITLSFTFQNALGQEYNRLNGQQREQYQTMFTYIFIGLLFVLAGVIGLQLTFIFYIERLYKMRVDHTRLLERDAKRLRQKIEFLEEKLSETNALLEMHGIEIEKKDEAWADILDDRS